jgi:hypothetical protein
MKTVTASHPSRPPKTDRCAAVGKAFACPHKNRGCRWLLRANNTKKAGIRFGADTNNENIPCRNGFIPAIIDIPINQIPIARHIS